MAPLNFFGVSDGNDDSDDDFGNDNDGVNGVSDDEPRSDESNQEDSDDEEDDTHDDGDDNELIIPLLSGLIITTLSSIATAMEAVTAETGRGSTTMAKRALLCDTTFLVIIFDVLPCRWSFIINFSGVSRVIEKASTIGTIDDNDNA